MMPVYEESTWGGKKAFVAKIEDKKIGHLVINDIYPMQNCIEIYSFQVLYDYRKKHIGKTLLRELVEFAHSNHVAYIRVVPAPCDDLGENNSDYVIHTPELIQVYQKLGFSIHPDFEDSLQPRMIYELNA